MLIHVLLCFSVGALAAAPAVSTARLSGGADVALVERSGLPLVRVEVSMATGELVETGRLDPAALAVLGDTWNVSARGVAPAAWRRNVAARGGLLGAACDTARCSFHLVAPAEEAPALVAAVGELVSNPTLPGPRRAQAAAALRRAWATEWASAATVHRRAVARLLWPAGHPNRLDRVSPPSVSARALRTAWRTVVGEAAALVTVVGDATLARLLPDLEAAFGPLRGSAGRATAPPALDARRAVLVDTGPRDDAHVSLVWRSPAAGASDHAAWLVVADSLVGPFTSRLNLRLRERDALTYRVDGGSRETPEHGRTLVELEAPAARLRDVLRGLDAELDRVRREGPTASELTAARARHAAGGEAEAYAELADVLWQSWSQRGAAALGEPIHDVSLESARAAAASWLATPRTLVVTGHADELEGALGDAGWPVERWSACHAAYGGRCP